MDTTTGLFDSVSTGSFSNIVVLPHWTDCTFPWLQLTCLARGVFEWYQQTGSLVAVFFWSWLTFLAVVWLFSNMSDRSGKVTVDNCSIVTTQSKCFRIESVTLFDILSS